MRKLVLIACSASKLAVRSKASELYQGQLFKASWKWAIAPGHADLIFILSAKHGLLHPLQLVEPYDQRLPKSGPELERWGREVVNGLVSRAGVHPPVNVTFLAGADYREPILKAWARRPPADWTWWAPLKGIGIGQQKAWLKKPL